MLTIWGHITQIYNLSPLATGNGDLYQLSCSERRRHQQLNLFGILTNPGAADEEVRLVELAEEHRSVLLLYYLRLARPASFPPFRHNLKRISRILAVYRTWRTLYDFQQWHPCRDRARIAWPKPDEVDDTDPDDKTNSSDSTTDDEDSRDLAETDEMTVQAFLFFLFDLQPSQSLLHLREELGWPEHVDFANWMLDRHCRVHFGWGRMVEIYDRTKPTI